MLWLNTREISARKQPCSQAAVSSTVVVSRTSAAFICHTCSLGGFNPFQSFYLRKLSGDQLEVLSKLSKMSEIGPYVCTSTIGRCE